MISRLEQVTGLPVSRETFEKIKRYSVLLVEAAKVHNLISVGTIDDVWERHIIDSAQLVRFSSGNTFADVGSGAGLPGLVIAILTGLPTTLIEPRRLRADFLREIKDTLSLENVSVIQQNAERVSGRFPNITSRAVASLARTFEMTRNLADGLTTWILPRGEAVQVELEQVKQQWKGDFRLEQSLTRRCSQILIARNVERKLAR